MRTSVLAIVAALGVSAAACSRTGAANQTAAELPTVAVAKVDRRDLAQTLTLAAEFRPFQEVDLHAKVAGYVRAIYVDVGDRVNAGQLLAELEIPEMRDELRQNDAAVRRSEEEVHRAQADVERAESGHQMTHLSTQRLAAVTKQRPNLVAQQDIDDATARDGMAEAQVATAKAALAAAEQQLEVAKATQNRTQTLFDYARITAPFTGVITHRFADTGSMIQAGTSSQTQAMPVVKLSQNDRLRLIIPVPESAVQRIHVRELVAVRVPTVGRTFKGTVARFSDSINTETRTMATEVDVENKDLQLVPGMYAYAELVLNTVSGALSVPVQALDRQDTNASVMVVSSGRVERREVKTGLEMPDRVQVTDGLHENDLVVVGNRGQLKPGATVTPKVVS